MTRRLLIFAFAALTILGALMIRGLLGEGGWQMAFGITFLVAGALGMLNFFFFARLKKSLDAMAGESRD